MKRLKSFLLILVGSIFIAACAEKNEATNENIIASNDEITGIYIYPLGASENLDEDEPDVASISLTDFTIRTEFVMHEEEEVFVYETELLDFKRTEVGFYLSYVNYRDVELKKFFEIKSDTVIVDEKNNWLQWSGPESWRIDKVEK